jgi:hypothetical protein
MRNSDSRRGGILMGLLLTAVTLVAIAVIVGFAVARNIRVDSVTTRDGDDVSIRTPAGNFSIRSHDHAGMSMVDVPHYPGAHEIKSGGSADFEWTSDDGRDQKNFSVAGGEMITQDPASKVLDYYRDQLPAWIVTHGRDGQTSLKEPSRGEGTGRRFIVIHEKADGTHIGVASVGTAAAN